MNLKEIFTDSLTYPLDKKGYGTLFILLLTSFLIIPGIMACGYFLRIIEYTTHGQSERPGFDDIKKLLIEGLRFLALGIIFGLIYYAILLYLYQLMGSLAMNNTLIYIVEAIYTILINSLYFMSLAHMASERRFTTAFQFNKTFGFMGEVGWIKYLAAITLVTLFGEVLNLLSSGVLLLSGLTGIWRIAIYLILTILVFTYLFTFESRFTGLIYPRRETEESEISATEE